MHQALYRKWRPQTFDDVYGQEHITSILRHETETGKFSHAYLFCGSRGTGKTTCAKILAKAVNCEHPVGGSPCNKCASCVAIDSGSATDVLEMDAASNNGVDNIRDIRDEVVYTPSLLKYRVYIVDEVHMLTGSAFNALLKTLEEPPQHVIFILATTELHKLPATIISRCQRFDFRRISTKVLMQRLSQIAKAEKIEVEDDALLLIAKLAQGGMRDAISLLELCAAGNGRITVDLVNDTMGSSGRESIIELLYAVADSDYEKIFGIVDEAVRSSKDIAVFWQELISYCRDILVFKTTSSADKYLDLTDSEKKQLENISSRFTKETLLSYFRRMDDAFYAMQRAGAVKRTIAETTLIKMSDQTLDTSNAALLSRISKLEAAMASGNFNISDLPPVTAAPTELSDAEKVGDREKSVKASSEKSEKSGTPKTEQNPVSKAPSAPTGGRMLRGWMEIVSSVTSDPMITPFLNKARVFALDDGKVEIRFPDDFTKSMIEQAQIKDSLRSAICSALKREVRDSELIYVVSYDGGDDINELDEIIQ